MMTLSPFSRFAGPSDDGGGNDADDYALDERSAMDPQVDGVGRSGIIQTILTGGTCV